jgi:hypothetical protein
MGNHDPYNTPEDRAEKTEEKKFQEEIGQIHDQLMKMRSNLFTVSELKWLMNIPYKIHQYHVPKYSKDDLAKLEDLRHQALKRKGLWVE